MRRIDLAASEKKSFENVDNGRRTDDEYLYILKAHLWAFGSGELKTTKKKIDHYPMLYPLLLIYLRIKRLFFYLHDVMKTVGGVKIPWGVKRFM